MEKIRSILNGRISATLKFFADESKILMCTSALSDMQETLVAFWFQARQRDMCPEIMTQWFLNDMLSIQRLNTIYIYTFLGKGDGLHPLIVKFTMQARCHCLLISTASTTLLKALFEGVAKEKVTKENLLTLLTGSNLLLMHGRRRVFHLERLCYWFPSYQRLFGSPVSGLLGNQSEMWCSSSFSCL